MSQADVHLPQQRGFGQTTRRDQWWVQPLLVFLGFSAFVVYTTWAAFQGKDYWFAGGGAQYLSPFYSPELWGNSPHAIFGPKPAWMPWPSWLVFSPALFILWAPGGFRFTCYYYRGAYYKAFWADPPNCTVGEPRKKYLGENSLPLIIQNVHRYFLYFALIFIVILSHDAWKSMWFTGADGEKHFGLAVGTLVLTINPILIAGYTLGCHSLRHLVGGRIDRLARRPARKKTYDCVSCLNRAHMRWAWVSLFWVGFADLYVRLCATDVWSDFRFF